MKNRRLEPLRNGLLVVLFTLGIVALIAWARRLEPPAVVTPRPALPEWRTEPTPTPASADEAASPAPPPAAADAAPAAAAGPPAAPAPAPAGVTFTARLRGPGGAPVAPDTAVFVGVTTLDPADVGEWEAALAGPHPERGPLRPEELARVVEWRPVAPVFDAPGAAPGEAILGPLALPAQPRFVVLAWDAAHVSYLADVIPPRWPQPGDAVDLGLIEGRPPTELVVAFEGTGPGEGMYAARLERVVAEAAAAAPLAALEATALEMMAPEMAFAYDDEAPLLLAADAPTRLAPLLPDAGLRLTIARANGAAAAPVEVELRPHATTHVTLDLDALFPVVEGGEADVVARVVDALDGSPLAGATVRWADPARPGAWLTDAEGLVTLPALPLDEEARFVVVPAVAAGPAAGRAARPHHAPLHEVGVTPRREPPLPAGAAPDAEGFVPPPEEGDGRGQWVTTWRIEPYRWLVVVFDAATRAEAERGRPVPYPVFVLERDATGEGEWGEAGAAEFLPEPEGMAISIAAPGRHRAVVALSAVWVVATAPALFDAATREARVLLTPEMLRPPAERRLLLRDARAGAPLAGAGVYVAAPAGGLPPLMLTADGFGEVALGPASAERLRLTIIRPGGEEWETEVAADAPGTERIEVEVP